MARGLCSRVDIGVPRDEAALADGEKLEPFTILAVSFCLFHFFKKENCLFVLTNQGLYFLLNLFPSNT